MLEENRIDDLPYDVLVAQGMEGLRLLTASHDNLFQLSKASWNVDQNTSKIVFQSPDGVTAVCPVQIIGTYNSLDSTFLWGWEHPSVALPLQEHAQKVREYGERHNIAELITQQITCPEDKVWDFVALAFRLNGAQGAYRGPSGTTFVFMTYGTVTLTKS